MLLLCRIKISSIDVTALICIVCCFLVRQVPACTDILVTPGASEDGSAYIAYNADSPTLMGMLYHYPASNKNSSSTSNSTNVTMRAIYDWDSGKYMGEIVEADVTYNVVGNTNEYGLIIGETTFGGISILAWNQTDAIMDYGSLIYVTLQRSKTVREAIETMVMLMDTYGYASGGESFSLADQSGEVWLMEVISRGNDYGKLGAVYVAQRIPDGMVAAHANQARIRTFDWNDASNCIYAPDVVDVAVHYGLYPSDADPLEFSFSDTYDPLTFIEARQGEARVWSIFSRIADSTGKFQMEYLDYALGERLSHRMPLYIKPYKKLVLTDLIDLMSSHYEDTRLDSSIDVGGGLFASPYRPRPLEWTYLNKTYHNERNIATAKTGWNFIGQVRPYMPQELSSIVWFACDDSSTAPRVPVYGSSKRLSEAYYGVGPQDGSAQPLLQFDLTKAFWIQNMVSNFAYSRWNNIYPILKEKLISVHVGFADDTKVVDERALDAYYNQSVEVAVNFVTLFTVNAGNTMQKIWTEFYGELFVRFRDYYTIVPKPDDPLCGCEAIEPGLSDAMKKRIVDETGEHYLVLEDRNKQKQIPPSLNGEHGPPFSQFNTNGQSMSDQERD